MATAVQIFDGVFESDLDHSSFEAGTRHMGVGSFRTRFDAVSARLVGNADGVHLSGSAAVDSIAIRNPPEMREHVVYGEDFFDAGRYPSIQFESSSLIVAPNGTIELVGSLTIKGITREIAATGTYRPPTDDPYGGVRAAIDLHTTIDRRDFAINWQAALPRGGNVLEWDVTIDARLEFLKV